MAKQGAELRTEISVGTVVRGTLRGAEDLVVRGRVEGTLVVEGALFVEKGAVVKADVTAERVVIAGALVGDVTATRSIEITADGRVKGDLASPKLRTEPGARFAGELTIGEAPMSEIPAPRPEPVARARPEIAREPEPEPEPEAPTERPRTPVTTFAASRSPHEERKKRRIVIKKRT